MMNFKKLLPTGFAVAAGLVAAVSQADANSTITYDSGGDVTPQLKVTINDNGFTHTMGGTMTVTEGFNINISSMNGTLDILALAWDFLPSSPPPVLQLPTVSTTLPQDGANGDIFVTGAWTPPGSEGATAPDGTTVDTSVDASDVPLSICNDLSKCPGSSSANFNGEIVFDENGPSTDLDYLLAIGTSGAGRDPSSDAEEAGFGDGLDGLELFIKYAGADLYSEEMGIMNPFSNLSLRGQSFANSTGGDGSFPKPGDETNPDGTPNLVTATSIKITLLSPLCTAGCEPVNPNEPGNVPEIDGPVLMQVGFALGGLYLLLMGRRRQEDELAHAA